MFVKGLMSYLRYLYLFAYSGVQHILCCVFALFYFVLCPLCCQFRWIVHFWFPLRYSLTFGCLRLLYPMLSVSLDCSFLIAPSVFSNVYLSCILCILCLQFLWIVYFLFRLRYSLMFICPVSCVPYVASVSRVSILIVPSVFSNVYLSCVFCTLCCQFLWIVHFWLPLRYSLTFICLVSCVPYVASSFGLSIHDCPFGIL